MMFSSELNAFAASRGEGLHPKLRELLGRAAALPFSEVAVRHDGMVQAGPDPRSETLTSRSSVTLFPHESRRAAVAHQRETEPRKRVP